MSRPRRPARPRRAAPGCSPAPWARRSGGRFAPRAELPAGERLRLAAEPVGHPTKGVERLGTGEDPQPQVGGVDFEAHSPDAGCRAGSGLFSGLVRRTPKPRDESSQGIGKQVASGRLGVPRKAPESDDRIVARDVGTLAHVVLDRVSGLVHRVRIALRTPRYRSLGSRLKSDSDGAHLARAGPETRERQPGDSQAAIRPGGDPNPSTCRIVGAEG